jgi:hypothetical protein
MLTRRGFLEIAGSAVDCSGFEPGGAVTAPGIAESSELKSPKAGRLFPIKAQTKLNSTPGVLIQVCEAF